MTAAGRWGVRVWAVGMFLLVSFGAALLLDCVVAATGGLGTSQAKVILTLRMLIPALAARVVCRFITHESWLRESGLAWRPPGSRGRLGRPRVLGLATAGVDVVAVAFALLLTLVIGAGRFSPDWALTSLMSNLRGIAPGGLPPPVAVIWVLMVMANTSTAYMVNGLVALGEETGWRGWLQLVLEPLGRRRGIVLTGVIWGLWHASSIVTGYEYGGRLPTTVGIVLFTCLCAGLGTLLSWPRVHPGSVLLATITHGTLNVFAPLLTILAASGGGLDLTLVGLIGWLVVVLFGFPAVLLLSGSWAGRTGAVQGAPS